MAAPPIDEWSLVDHLTSWVTWGIGGVVAIVSATITSTYFFTTIRNDIEDLQKRMDESAEDRAQLRKNLREVVHDLRNEFMKMHGDNQVLMKRIDDHVLRVDERASARFDQVINLIINRNFKED